MKNFFGRAMDEPHLRRAQAGLAKMTPAEFRDYLLSKPIRLLAPLAAARENGNLSLGIPVSR